MPKRILIVDDLPELRKLIRAFLEEELGFHVCGEAVDGFDIEAAPRLKKILPRTPIILFAVHEGLMKGLDVREICVDAVMAMDRGMSALLEEELKAFCRP